MSPETRRRAKDIGGTLLAVAFLAACSRIWNVGAVLFDQDQRLNLVINALAHRGVLKLDRQPNGNVVVNEVPLTKPATPATAPEAPAP